MMTVGCTQQQMIAEGFRFARFVVGNVDPSESDDHRETVESARKVLELFDEDGGLPQGSDRPFVVAAISTLVDAANFLFETKISCCTELRARRAARRVRQTPGTVREACAVSVVLTTGDDRGHR